MRVRYGRLDVRRNFFSVRVAGLWNSIPGHIKDLKTVAGLKTGKLPMHTTAEILPRGAKISPRL